MLLLYTLFKYSMKNGVLQFSEKQPIGCTSILGHHLLHSKVLILIFLFFFIHFYITIKEFMGKNETEKRKMQY